MKLRKRDFIPPQAGLTKKWGLLVCSSESHLQSKTGASDESIMLDNQTLPWLGDLLPALVEGEPSDLVWNFTYPEIVAELRKTNKVLKTSMVPYQLRHAGPSWDRLKHHRGLQDIQKRGRWKAFKSVLRSEKATLVLQEFKRLPLALQRHCNECVNNLKEILLGY